MPDDDKDPLETQEWRDALGSVVEFDGPDRASYLLKELNDEARRHAVAVPVSATTPYVNTIPVDAQPPFPGDRGGAPDPVAEPVERGGDGVAGEQGVVGTGRAHRLVPVVGHVVRHGLQPLLARPGRRRHGGDLLFVQGHVSPGIYARSFLEGRISEEQLLKFRQEVGGDGLSSYPHPWLMPEYWQFPTVSMGLGPLMAIYQARFLKYLDARGLADTEDRHVWAFLGDGEMDEPESLGAISMAAREKLDNLIFVVNCNLQRLDGPVRGNGKIIQELEGVFRGAGWNVIKVIWGSGWDPLLAADKSGLAAAAHGGVRRRRVPGLQVQGRRLRAPALLRQVPRAAGHGPRHVRRRDLGALPRRARPGEGLRRLSGPRWNPRASRR